MSYIVNVINKHTQEVELSIKADTERKAEKVEAGIHINLDHEDFYTRIEEEL